MCVRKKDRRMRCLKQNPRKSCIQEPSKQIKAVRKCLGEKEVVLIGGKPRQKTRLLIEQALGVSLRWIETTGTESYLRFECAVNRHEVAIVILAIRWSRHGFTKVKDLCKKAQKPFVNLPAGYNPNQLAYQILLQCGRLLGCEE